MNVTPAYIEYETPEGVTGSLRFHEIIEEDHSASSEITKYPVQSGFEVTRHAIRKNRVVGITAIISNVMIEGSATGYKYSTTRNASRVFDIIKNIVNLKYRCKVITNLGEYYPVYFNRFKTKQKAGSVDSMTFTMSGEEVIVANSINSSSPTVVAFTELEAANRDAIILRLRELGYHIFPNAKLFKGNAALGEDFVISGLDSVGQSVDTTYICDGQDPTTGDYSYSISTTDIGVYSDLKEAAINTLDKFSELSSGINQLSECALGGSVLGDVEDTINLIKTPLGPLAETAYGALVEKTTLGLIEKGQALSGILGSCVVRDLYGLIPESLTSGASLPTSDEITQGAIRLGDSVYGPSRVSSIVNGVVTTPTEFIKIESA